jgi:XRE family transcriptional regulator, regulator of sulfur utilization
MSHHTELIGNRLKTIRAQRGMTLEDVARLTGVSKPMLGQIERGQSNPTITTLNKIATGLKVPVTTFFKEEEPEFTVAGIGPDNLMEEKDGLIRACTMFPYDSVRNMELFYLEIDPGCRHGSDKHMEGTEEYILVLRGKLELTVGGKSVTLHKQQAVRFRADLPHEYHNPYGECCSVYNLIFYSAN